MDYHNIFWTNIQRIQDILAINDFQVGEMFDLSSNEFTILKKTNGLIDLQRMDKFLDKVGMSLDNFFEGNFNKEQVQNFYLGPSEALPERYDFAKYSKARTLINCLTYIKLKYGNEFKNGILRSLQMDIRFFENPEHETNIKLLKDLCKTLSRFGLTDNDFLAMGRMSYQTNRESKLGQSFRQHRNIEDLMADICESQSRKFDQNFDYFITGRGKGEISVGSRPTEHVLEHLGHSEMVSDEICLTKLGVFGTFPQYLNYKNSYAVKTKCMREGSSYYEYKISFS